MTLVTWACSCTKGYFEDFTREVHSLGRNETWHAHGEILNFGCALWEMSHYWVKWNQSLAFLSPPLIVTCLQHFLLFLYVKIRSRIIEFKFFGRWVNNGNNFSSNWKRRAVSIWGDFPQKEQKSISSNSQSPNIIETLKTIYIMLQPIFKNTKEQGNQKTFRFM